MSLQTPIKIRTLQRKLYRKAKDEPEYRFYLLYDKIYREDILAHAYELARANRGAPGVDGQSFEQIESQGLALWLTGLRNELGTKGYKPQPVQRVMIPKPGGGRGRLAFQPFGIEWFKLPPSWCWNRSLRRIWNPVLMGIDRSEVRETLSRECTSFSAKATPISLTQICPNTLIRFRTGNLCSVLPGELSIARCCVL